MDMGLAANIARDSGMNLVLSTGWYVDQYAKSTLDVCYRPPEFRDNTAETIAQGMIDDITVGMKGTGVKAGIIKIAVTDLGSGSDRKLLKAAAIAQRETGVSISTHTSPHSVRMGTLDYLEGAGVDPGRIYLGHSDAGNGGITESLALVKRGCSVLYTIWGIFNPNTIGWGGMPLARHFSSYVTAAMVDEGYADKVLFSIDYSVNYTNGDLYYSLYDIPERSPLYAFTYAVPQLKKLGVSQEDLDTIMIDNPRKMLSIQDSL